MSENLIQTQRQPRKYVIQPILQHTHSLIQQAFDELEPDVPRFAIDATCGNGHDTVMLAKQVGVNGIVASCDIQMQALTSARLQLQQAGLMERVHLYEIGHEALHTLLDPSWLQNVTAITANLGYLPGSDKHVITRVDTTLQMLETLLPYLRISGVMTVVAYGGHAGGHEEVEAVYNFVKKLPMTHYRVLSYTFVNPTGTPPILYAIERIK